MDIGLVCYFAVIVLYGALAGRLSRWWITGPMVFVGAGYLLGPGGLGWLDLAPDVESIKQLTEITLAILLFADASTLDLRKVEEDANLPLRLLTVGLLLTIGLGALVAALLLNGEGLAFAALIGAILAPTDAALGLSIFNNPRVPSRIRRALNVESGLNDGISTPFVTLFVALAVSETTGQGDHWLATALSEIGLALVAGAAIGFAGGWLLIQARRRKLNSGAAEQIAVLALALTAYFGSLALQGNGFIAAFVAGIVFRVASSNQMVESAEVTENFGTFLSVLVWGVFGAVMLPLAFQFTTDVRPILYAVLSLTMIRMAPVAIALMGAGLRRDTVAVMGWFGPRGLASVVFTLLAFVGFSEVGKPVDTLLAVACWTILLSVFAHGISAAPLSAWYANRLAKASPPPAELMATREPNHRRGLL
ncbi:MAG: cation:proton antiporter [Caldilineales bacterium]